MQLPDVVTTDNERPGNGQSGLDFVRRFVPNGQIFRTTVLFFPRLGRSKNPCPLFRDEIHVEWYDPRYWG